MGFQIEDGIDDIKFVMPNVFKNSATAITSCSPRRRKHTRWQIFCI